MMKTKICPECGAINTVNRDICFQCEKLITEKPVEIKTEKGKNWIVILLGIVNKLLFSKLSLSKIFFILIIFGVLVFLSIPNFIHSGSQKIWPRCIANIKMLENALEMYDMDTPPGDNDKTTVVCQEGRAEGISKYCRKLRTGGYIENLPKCPITGTIFSYSVNREDASHGYALYVSCSIHGTISRQTGKD